MSRMKLLSALLSLPPFAPASEDDAFALILVPPALPEASAADPIGVVFPAADGWPLCALEVVLDAFGPLVLPVTVCGWAAKAVSRMPADTSMVSIKGLFDFNVAD